MKGGDPTSKPLTPQGYEKGFTGDSNAACSLACG